MKAYQSSRDQHRAAAKDYAQLKHQVDNHVLYPARNNHQEIEKTLTEFISKIRGKIDELTSRCPPVPQQVQDSADTRNQARKRAEEEAMKESEARKRAEAEEEAMRKAEARKRAETEEEAMRKAEEEAAKTRAAAELLMEPTNPTGAPTNPTGAPTNPTTAPTNPTGAPTAPTTHLAPSPPAPPPTTTTTSPGSHHHHTHTPHTPPTHPPTAPAKAPPSLPHLPMETRRGAEEVKRAEDEDRRRAADYFRSSNVEISAQPKLVSPTSSIRSTISAQPELVSPTSSM